MILKRLNMILKEIKYLLENYIFSNNITKKHILYISFYNFNPAVLFFIYFTYSECKNRND